MALCALMWASESMTMLSLTQGTFKQKETQVWGQSEEFSLGHIVFGIPVMHTSAFQQRRLD